MCARFRCLFSFSHFLVFCARVRWFSAFAFHGRAILIVLLEFFKAFITREASMKSEKGKHEERKHSSKKNARRRPLSRGFHYFSLFEVVRQPESWRLSDNSRVYDYLHPNSIQWANSIQCALCSWPDGLDARLPAQVETMLALPSFPLGLPRSAAASRLG